MDLALRLLYRAAVTQPKLPFRGAPPARDTYVLGQAAPFPAARWKELLPDPAWWPEELDACPRGHKWPLLDRRTVFTIAQRAGDPLGAVQTLVASCVWGTGTSAQSVTRVARTLGQQDLPQRLVDVVTALSVGGAADAFDLLHGHGNVIAGLGPSFGTKFLYFAGFGRGLGEHQPLILDDRVALAVRRLSGVSWPYNRRDRSVYTDYLALAQRWAVEWGAEEPDVVERCLFSVGYAPSLAVAVLTGGDPVIG